MGYVIIDTSSGDVIEESKEKVKEVITGENPKRLELQLELVKNEPKRVKHKADRRLCL